MRRTARPHLAALGVDRFFAERSLNHKLGHVEGIYDRHDCFGQDDVAQHAQDPALQTPLPVRWRDVTLISGL